MPEKALIRANDEFWRIRQWFSIRKEKNACTGRFLRLARWLYFSLRGDIKTSSGKNFLCCDRFVVDLQSYKNPKGSTTISFSLSFLQPSAFHSIDGTFVMAYTKFARNLSG
jgi:hypothetical protein